MGLTLPPPPPHVTQDLPDIASLELGSGQGEDGVSSEPGEAVKPPRTRSEAPFLPSEDGGPGKKGQLPPAAVHPNPSLSEPRGVEHTLPHGEELAGFTQALLPLCS